MLAIDAMRQYRMFTKTLPLLSLIALGLLAGCGKDKDATNADSGSASLAGAPSKDFASLTGISKSGGQCPYVELAGVYKVSSGSCESNGKPAPIDYYLVPTRFTVYEISGTNGTMELSFSRDGHEMEPFSLDFPRQLTAKHERLGVQCNVEGDALTLMRSCNSVPNEKCFNSLLSKGGKVTAVISRVRDGGQYWCRLNLRKVTD